MSVLPNDTAPALQDIKAAIVNHVTNTNNSGNVWERIRYADNLNQWLELAAVVPLGGTQVVRVCFVWLSGLTTEKVEFRQRKITATYSIEIIQGFADGDGSSNSTLTYENLLGDLEKKFSRDDCLGFTDPASQAVENGGFNANPGENEGKPVYVDGILAHRTTGTVQVMFRQCTNGG